MVLELAGKTNEAQQALSDARGRWPEVAAIWVAQGVIEAAHSRTAEARKTLATAVSLGAHTAEAVDPMKLFLGQPPQDW